MAMSKDSVEKVLDAAPRDFSAQISDELPTPIASFHVKGSSCALNFNPGSISTCTLAAVTVSVISAVGVMMEVKLTMSYSFAVIATGRVAATVPDMGVVRSGHGTSMVYEASRPSVRVTALPSNTNPDFKLEQAADAAYEKSLAPLVSCKVKSIAT